MKIIEDGQNWYRHGTLFPLVLGLYFSTSEEAFMALLGTLVTLVPQCAHNFFSIFTDSDWNRIVKEERHKMYLKDVGEGYKGDDIDEIGELQMDPAFYLAQSLYAYIIHKNLLVSISQNKVESDKHEEDIYLKGVPEYFFKMKFLPAILICYLMGATGYWKDLVDGDVISRGAIVFLFNNTKTYFNIVENSVKEILKKDLFRAGELIFTFLKDIRQFFQQFFLLFRIFHNFFQCGDKYLQSGILRYRF